MRYDHDLMPVFHETQCNCDVWLNISTRTDRSAEVGISYESAIRHSTCSQKGKPSRRDLSATAKIVGDSGKMSQSSVRDGQRHGRLWRYAEQIDIPLPVATLRVLSVDGSVVINSDCVSNRGFPFPILFIFLLALFKLGVITVELSVLFDQFVDTLCCL